MPCYEPTYLRKKDWLVASYIKINEDRDTRITRHRDPNDEWDANDTATSTSISGFEVVEDGGFHDLTVPFDPVADRDYYLLSVRYSTGDSFSRHRGKMEHIMLHADLDLAKANAKHLREFHERGENDPQMDYEAKWNTTIKLDNGEDLPVSTMSWTGYFERLEEVIVETVRLNGGRWTF